MAIYLDHAATTPVRDSVIALYAQQLQAIGNPSSVHGFGQRSRQIVEQAREDIAKAINCDRNEVIFTSGGTESDNLAIKGIFASRNQGIESIDGLPARSIVISSGAEHHAVIEPIEWLVAERGAQAVWIPLDVNGQPDLAWLESFLAANAERVALISLMWANNETGAVTNIPAVTALAAKFDVPVHSDAVATLGHYPIEFAASGLAAMSITGHKIGAPVGRGALIVGRKTKLQSLLQGGSHERGLRAGTMDAAGSAAFASAVVLAVGELNQNTALWRELQQQLIDGVKTVAPETVVVAQGGEHLYNITNLIFEGCSGDSMLFMLDSAGVAVSNGSACNAGVTSASHVLVSLGFTERQASSCVRVSFGHLTTAPDIDALLAALPTAIERAKKAGFTSF
jgi:cysteine desulfurase